MSNPLTFALQPPNKWMVVDTTFIHKPTTQPLPLLTSPLNLTFTSKTQNLQQRQDSHYVKALPALLQ